MAEPQRDQAEGDGGKRDDLPPVPSPPAEVVSGEEKTWFTRAAIGAVTALILLAAWGVVALSIYIIIQVARGQGVADGVAALIAAPALIVPVWKTCTVLRQPTLERALLGHLWVLNGAAGWAVIALAGLWWTAALRSAAQGNRTGLLVVLLIGGFPPLFALLVALNWWLLRRQR